MKGRLRTSLRGQWAGVALGCLALLVASGAPTEAARAVKKALFAKKAGNAKKVGGIRAAKQPQAGRLLPLGADARFPVAVIPASNSVIRFETFVSNGTGMSGHVNVGCAPGERATGGGIGWTGSPGVGDAVTYSGPEDSSGDTFPAQGSAPTGWAGEIATSDGPGKNGRVYVVCASP